MKRALRILGWTIGGLLGLVVLLVAVALGVPNTDFGRRLIAREAGPLTGGMVTLSGLSGRFPDRLRVARVEVRDKAGVWLTLDQLALDWSPLALLSRQAHVERLAAAAVALARLPESSGSASSSGGGGFSLPVQVQVDAIHVDRIALAAPVAGAPAALGLDGHLALASLTAGAGELALRRLDGAGTYRLEGHADAATIAATLHAAEPAGGLVSGLAGLPDLGALALDLDVDGPWTAVAAKLALAAGEMRASATGTLDAVRRSGTLDLAANAPAMRPRPDVGWQGVKLAAHVSGPMLAPAATGQLTVTGLEAAGAGAATVQAELSGDAGGKVAVDATVAGLRIPGGQPGLFAVAPVRLRADIDLAAADRPLHLHVAHPLLALDGTVDVGPDRKADLALGVPDLGGFGVDLKGHAGLHLTATMQGETTRFATDGTLAIDAGLAPAPALIGSAATFTAAGELHGSDVTLRSLHLAGAKLGVDGSGSLVGGVAATQVAVTLPELAVLAPSLSGALKLETKLAGRLDALTADATLAGTLGTTGFPAAPVTASLHAEGLPGSPSGTLSAQATLEGAPLTLAATAQRTADGTLSVTVQRADWKSAHLEGTALLPPGAAVPQAHVAARMAHLDDLRRLTGADLGGSFAAEADIAADAKAKLHVEAHDIAGADSIRLDGTGPAEALALTLAVTGMGADVTAAATLDMPARKLALARLGATWKGETLRLLSPATIAFADGVAVDRLRLGLRGAVLDVAGRVSPALDVTASLRNLPLDLVDVVSPGLGAAGTIQADARLTGTPARPAGTMRLNGSGLRLTKGPGAAFAPATLIASATLAGESARVESRVNLGANQVTLTGTAPIAATGSANLRAIGKIDLTLLDPLLAADGRRVRGVLTLDAGITGKLAAPRASGTLRLAGGEVQDLAQGVRIRDIAAVLRADGETVRIESFTGRAGEGTIGVTGSVGLVAPMPIDVRLTMRNAAPLASDLLTVVLDADLSLRGALSGQMTAGGTVKIQSAEIRVPERLPTSVAVLNVRRPGDRPAASVVAARPAPPIALDIGISAPARVFVRGRGIDAELSGSLHVGGTVAAPRPVGTLTLRRGQISVAGTVLTFSSGTVGLDGSGRLDPTIDFKATSSNGNIVATLEVSGTASAPKITLSSVPDLPQDEVLAHLLFGTSIAKLGPLQLASIAAGLAELSGAGGGFQPLESIRRGLGLDRLSVGAGANGSSNLEAGRYVAPGVYVGAKQGLSGTGTQATVQVDLYRGLKLETDVGTSSGSSATGASDSGGSSVGLTYQFEY